MTLALALARVMCMYVCVDVCICMLDLVAIGLHLMPPSTTLIRINDGDIFTRYRARPRVT